MVEILKITLIITGIAFIINAVAYGAVSNYTFGIAAVFMVGLIFVLAGIFLESILSSVGFLKWISVLIATGCAVSLCLSLFLAYYGTSDTVDYNEDALIVLGAGLHGDRISLPLKYRLDKAYLYYTKNKNVLIVVSGGQGPGETVPEGYAMKKYLVSKGVPEDRIKEENHSTSTYENFYNSKKILDTEFNNGYRVAFVTNSFHVFRAKKIAGTVGFTPNHMGAKIQWYSVLANYLRECAAVMKYFILRR